MDPLDKLEIVNCIAPECRGERHGELFELLQVLSKIDAGNVVDYIQEGHTGTCVACRLALAMVSRSPKKAKSSLFPFLTIPGWQTKVHLDMTLLAYRHRPPASGRGRSGRR